MRVLRVLDFNEEHLAKPLNKDALDAMLGQYTREANESAQGTLFDD